MVYIKILVLETYAGSFERKRINLVIIALLTVSDSEKLSLATDVTMS